MPERFGITAFDRPELSLTNLLEFGPESALRSLIKPASLTPGERRSPAQRMGIEGLAGGVWNVVSDPFLLLSLILSWRFPVVALKDMFKTVAPRFSAKMNKLSGPMYRTRDPYLNFEETAIPGAFDDIAKVRVEWVHEYIAGGLGESVARYEKAIGRRMTPTDFTKLFATVEDLQHKAPYGFPKLGPGLDRGVVQAALAEKPFRELVGEWKVTFGRMKDRIFKDPKFRESIVEHYHEMHKRQMVNYARHLKDEVGLGPAEVRKAVGSKREQAKLPAIDGSDLDTFLKLSERENYQPHYIVATQTSVEEHVKRVMLAGSRPGSVKLTEVSVKSMMEQMTTMGSRSVLQRQEAMLPGLRDLALLEEAGWLRRGWRDKVKGMLDSANAKAARGEGRPILEYGMQADRAASEYVHSMSSMDAWVVRGNGAKIMEEYEIFAGFTKVKGRIEDPIRARMLENTYIPMALGRMTPKQAERAGAWAQTMIKTAKSLDSPWGKMLPEDLRKTLKGWVLDSADRFAQQPLSRTIQGFLYMSTLGGNVAAAAQNTFQIALTLGPLIGVRNALGGMDAGLKKAGSYFSMRFGKGFPHEEAFRRAFPHYHQSGLPLSPIAEEAVGRMLAGSYDSVAGAAGVPMVQGLKTAGQKAKQALMSVFGLSESAVRIASFEGAMLKGAREGLPLAERMGLARQVVNRTQFVPGVSGMPLFLAGQGPLARQLLQFPARLFGFVTGTALRAGSGVKALGPNWGPFAGMNPGTLARMYIWSDVISEVGSQVFGTNLEQSLLLGAMPTFRSGGPFAPIPVVPPAFSLVGAPMMDLAKGDMEFTETRRATPLLVPGGVAMARAVGFAPVPGGPEVARFLQKRYVDYGGVTRDGRYPVYTSGRGLVGYMTGGEALMQAVGVPVGGGSTKQVEQELVNMIVSNRKRIREMKREYVRAVVGNNMRRAQAIDREFTGLFPGLKTIRNLVKKSDFENAHKRLVVTRMEQLLDTLPAEVRPLYAQVLQTAMMGAGPEVLGLGPGGLTSAGTSRGRERKRIYGKYRGHRVPRGNYRQQMTPFRASEIDQGEISFRPVLDAFDSFRSFDTAP